MPKRGERRPRVPLFCVFSEPSFFIRLVFFEILSFGSFLSDGRIFWLTNLSREIILILSETTKSKFYWRFFYEN